MSEFTVDEINTYKFYWLDAHDITQPAAVKGAEIIKQLQEQLEQKDEEIKDLRAHSIDSAFKSLDKIKDLKARNEKLERVVEAAKELHDNRLGWSDGRNPYAPPKFWGDLALTLNRLEVDDQRIKESAGGLNELAELTTKRIGMLTEVELIFSIKQLPDYPDRSRELLDAIHNHDDEQIGKALKLYLFNYNQTDILLHEGL